MNASAKKLIQLTVITASLVASPLYATQLTWDADPTTATVQDGTGTWDTVTNTWWDGANNVSWDNTTPADALFGSTSGTAGAVTVAAGTTINVGNLTVNASSLGNYNFTPGDANSRLSFSPSSVVSIANGLTVTNTVILTGSSSFTKSGPGTFWIRPATANLNSGATVVTQGTLIMGSSSGRVVVPGDLIVTNTGDARLGAANTISNNATVSVASGASFEMNGNALSVANFILNGGTVTQTSTEALTTTNLDARSGALAQSGASTGKFDAGTVTKSTSGTVTLTTRGSAAATGGITNTIVNAGTLVLDYTQSASKLCDVGTLTVNGGTLAFTNGSTSESVSTVILAGGVITNTGGTSKLMVPSGNYDVRAGAAYTVLAGAAGLIKTTPGVAVLAAVETYTGGTLISGGTLQLGDGTTSGTLSTTGGGPVTNNAVLVLNPGPAGASYANNISGSGSLIMLGNGTAALTGANSYQGSTTLSNGVLTLNSSATLGDGTGTLNLSGGTLSITASRTPATAPIANPVNVTADTAITTTSTSATVDFNLANDSVTGTGGTLTFRNDAPSGTGLFEPRFTGAVNFTRPIVIANGTFGTTRLDSFNLLGTTQTFSGNLSGTGGYRRNAGAAGTGGTTIFNGNNTYTGPTDVFRGQLSVNGTLGTNAVTVSATGTLGGNGTINGPVTIQSGGTLAVGNSIGTLTISNTLTFSVTSTNISELNKTLGTNDLVRGLSVVAYNGILVVNNLSGTLAANDTFKIFDAATYTGSFTSSNLPALGAGLSWDLSGLTNNGTIKVTGASTAPPQIGSVSLSGSNLILTGTGGTAGADYWVLTSTNLTLPRASWTSIATNQFITGGNFNFTNAVDITKPALFYMLQVP